MRYLRGRRIIGIAAAICLLLQCAAAAESLSLRTMLNGEFGFPVTVRISSPVYQKLAQYGEERLGQLNSLMKHFSIETHTDGAVSETSVLIDGNTVYNVSETEENGLVRRQWSVEPDTVYLQDAGASYENNSALTRFQDSDFYPVNQLMDEARDVLEEIGRQYSESGKSEKVSLNYKSYGKAVKRITIRFTKDFVAEHFPEALVSCAAEPAVRAFLGSLSFEGVQRIILVYDEGDHLLRAIYDGVAGGSPSSLRKVSLSWKCLRSDDHLMDELTLRTPAVKGYDKYNMTYTRDMDLTEAENHRLSWNMDLDRREGDTREKITYKADLSHSDGVLGGQITYTEKGNGKDVKTVIIPAIAVKNTGECSGTLEITEYSGKIVISDIVSDISVCRSDPVRITEKADAKSIDISGPSGQEALKSLEQALAVQLIRSMLALPKEDTVFLSEDIPDEVWNTLTQSIF